MGKSGRVSYRCLFGLPRSKGEFPGSCRKADVNTADFLQAREVPRVIVLARWCSAAVAQGCVEAALWFAGPEPPADAA